MFKRANKVTALLVAAASVMSVVPAMAADTTRLGNKEGTVKQGIAFGDGSYAYYGYRTDSDETGIWYNKDGGTKDTFNDDLEDYRFDNDSKYGTKYAYAKESSNKDEYLVDLSTGKAIDDETAEEKAENAKSKLVTQIKKADRYESRVTKASDLASVYDSTTAAAASVGTFDQILKGQFGEVWYQFNVTTSAGATISYVENGATATTTSDAIYTGFVNETGKYIDLSLDTNIRVYSTYTGRAEWIKEYGTENKDAKLKVDLIDVDAVAQDKDYIYAIAKVKVTYTNTLDTGALQAPEVQYFLQKISKAQGSKDDDEAYAAKSIDSYQLQTTNTVSANSGNIYDNEDMTDAYKALTDDSSQKLLGITVKDGFIYVVRTEVNSGTADKLHIYKLKMGKSKDEAQVGANLGKDVDYNALTQDDDTDNGDIVSHDYILSDVDAGLQGFELVLDRNNQDPILLAGQPVYRLPSVSIDTNGSVWALEKGKVDQYTGIDKKTVYTVDRAIDALDVYDDKNLIVWEIDGDVYTNISEGHKVTTDDGVAVDPNLVDKTTITPVKVGWDKLADGTYNFYNVSGVKQASYWANDNGTWYWIKADGVMKSAGWELVNGTWYLFNGSGAMLTGWQLDGGAWYYLAPSGAMLANTTVDGYVLGASGAWVK